MSKPRVRKREPVSYGGPFGGRESPRERVLPESSASAVSRVAGANAPRSPSPQANSISSIGTLLDHISTGVAIVRFRSFEPFSWKLVHINSLAASLVGRSGGGLFSEGIGQNLPGGPERVTDCFRSVLHSRKQQILGRLKFERHGANPSHYMTRAVPLDATTIAVTFEDVSDYENARRQLAVAEKQMKEVAAAGVIAWKADPNTWTFHYISPEAQELLGYWPERWFGERNFFFKRICAEDRDVVRETCAEVMKDSKSRQLDCRVLAVDGETKCFRMILQPSFASFEQREISGLMIDITAVKMAEAAASELSVRLLQAQDDERRRISRELHDSVGQYLSAAKMTLKMLQQQDIDIWERRDKYVNQCEELIEQAVREVRTVSYLLHPPLLDEVGLASALKWLAEGLSDRSGVRLDVDVPDATHRLEPHVEMALFRIAQEALTNVHRHSHSDCASLRLKIKDSQATLEIEDRGAGLPSELSQTNRSGHVSGGVGLPGMRERAKELSGTLEVVPTGQGTLVRAVVPLKLKGAVQGNGGRPKRKTANGGGAPAAKRVRAASA